MKISKVRELLSKMTTRNKHYYFVMYCLSMGEIGAPISPKQLHLLEKLMDKKSIKFRPSKIESFIRGIVFKIQWWWLTETPWAKRESEKFRKFLTNN